MITEGSCCNCAITTHCASCTLYSSTKIYTFIYTSRLHRVHTFVWSTATHWLLHSSSWLVPITIAVRVEKGVKLSTGHLVVCNLRLVKPTGSTQPQRCRKSYRIREVLMANDVRSFAYSVSSVFVQRYPGMHSRGRVGTVASSAAQLYGRKWLGVVNNGKKVSFGGTRRWKMLFEQRK